MRNLIKHSSLSFKCTHLAPLSIYIVRDYLQLDTGFKFSGTYTD